MTPARLSLTRKFLLWYFQYPPFNPYVTVSLSVEVAPTVAYLDALNRGDGPRVSLSHLVTGAIARTYAEHPFANASVSGRDVLLHRHVGAAMPVDMRGGGGAQELGIALVREAETHSLRDLARAARADVAQERGSRGGSLRRLAYRFIDHVPRAPFAGLLSAADLASRLPPVGRLMHRQLPLTVLVSNIGAAIETPNGAAVRGGTIALPGRFFQIGSLLGIFSIQDEVVAIDGRPEVRAMLPITYVFDHRLFDGVAAGRLLTRLQAILADPEATFGPDGTRPGPPHVRAQRERVRAVEPRARAR